MKFSKYMLLLFAIVVLCCRKIIDYDIRHADVILLSPQNNLRTQYQKITFAWSEVEYATKYQLQIGLPCFDSLIQIITDTLTEANYITLTLTPGNYEWRVCAINQSYKTNYTARRIIVDTSSNLSFQYVELLQPVSTCILTNTPDFVWKKITSVDFYEIQITEGGDFQNGVNLLPPTRVDTNFYHLTVPLNNMQYTWGVRAVNSSSTTSWTSIQINHDNRPPDSPILVSPLNNANLAQAIIAFKWTSGDYDALCGETDILQLAIDSGFSQVIKTYTISSNEQSDTLTVGNYYWRVKRMDHAGNETYSSSNQLTIF